MIRLFTYTIVVFLLGLIFSWRVASSSPAQARLEIKPLVKVRQGLAQNLDKLLPSREATLVAGTVLGIDKIDKRFKEELIKTGTIHVVVVSGQNLSIVAGFFLALSPYIGKRKSLLLSVTACFLYALLTGFEPPVVRATIMVLAATLAVYFGREANVIASLILAAAVIIFVWPQAITEISFQLTFAATLGIATLGRRLAKMWSKYPYVGENAAIATSAYLFTAPIIIYYFGRVSLLSPFANILVAEAVAPVMILGFLVIVSSLIFLPMAQLLAYFSYVPAFFFVKVVELFAKFDAFQIQVGRGNLVLVLVGYFMILGLILIWTRKPKSS